MEISNPASSDPERSANLPASFLLFSNDNVGASSVHGSALHACIKFADPAQFIQLQLQFSAETSPGGGAAGWFVGWAFVKTFDWPALLGSRTRAAPFDEFASRGADVFGPSGLNSFLLRVGC